MSIKALRGIKRVVLSMLASFGLLASLLLPTAAYAQNSTTITASSSAGTVSKDAQFQVTIYVNSAQAVTLVQALITYDSSKLALTGAPSYEDSPLTQESPDNIPGDDLYQVSRFKAGGPYPSGTFKLAEFTFRALEDSGSTTINIDPSGSAVFVESPAGENVLSSTSGVIVNLAAYADTPLPGTQLIVKKDDGTSELRSTPAVTDGNNGTPTEADIQTEEEKAALADSTAERTKSAVGASDATADTPEDDDWWTDYKIMIPAALLALLIIIAIALTVRRSRKAAGADTAPKFNFDGPIESDQPTVVRPDDKDR